jgi:hypothetical protein
VSVSTFVIEAYSANKAHLLLPEWNRLLLCTQVSGFVVSDTIKKMAANLSGFQFSGQTFSQITFTRAKTGVRKLL